MTGNVFTGIDIGSESIKFASVRKGKGGKLRLVNAGIAPLGDISALPDGDSRTEGIAAILRSLLAERKAKVRKAYICASGKKVITRYAHVPPMPPKRLEKVMSFEIDNEAPGGEEVASDFKLLDLPNKDSEFTILIGMAKEEVIVSQKKVFDQIGIGVEDVTLGSLPTYHSIAYAKQQELEELPGPCAVVNIGAEKMEMCVMYGTRLYFARNLTPGANTFVEAIREELRIPYENAQRILRERGRLGDADAPDIPVIPLAKDDSDISSDLILDDDSNLHDEETSLGEHDDEQQIPKIVGDSESLKAEDPIKRVLERSAHALVNSMQSCLRFAKAQTKLQNLDVCRIYVTGGGAQIPGLAQHIQSRLGIETVTFDPLENVDCSKIDAPGKQILENNSLAFTTALGLAAGRATGSSMEMSLLPKAEKERQNFLRQEVYAIAAAGIFGITVVGMLIGSWKATNKLQQFVAKQDAAIKQAENQENRLKDLQTKNTDLAEKVDILQDTILNGRTYLSALSVLKGKDGENGFTFPPEVNLQRAATFDKGYEAEKYKTFELPKTRYGTVSEKDIEDFREKIEQKSLYLTGYFPAGTGNLEKFSKRVDEQTSRRIVRGLIDYLQAVQGPLGNDVFKSVTLLTAYGENEREFRLKLDMNNRSAQ